MDSFELGKIAGREAVHNTTTIFSAEDGYAKAQEYYLEDLERYVDRCMYPEQYEKLPNHMLYMAGFLAGVYEVKQQEKTKLERENA